MSNFSCLLFFVFLFIGCSQKTQKINIPDSDLPKIMIEKYVGRWYEIATIPIWAQRNCKCTFAEYELGPNKDYLLVYNECKEKGSGKIKSIKGKAFLPNANQAAKLKVQFFWPFKSDYYIYYIDSAYSVAIVGNPNGKYLWLLSRKPVLDKTEVTMLIDKAKLIGFDTNKLVFTVQCEE